MAERKIPLRKCIGCNEMKDKRELVRIVRNKEGEISVDLTGKKPGRGAYICKSIDCLNKAQKAKRLERAFSTAIEAEIYDTLRSDLSE
ncbi:MAG: YlxR family protein [Ruminococcus sp.]|nr:YlxR family protein [Ruminococcus sp.]MBQ1617410.1 YlxR family protein [Ruminococcus sp.]MBQ1898641.1 YlxR family protein [Ruminococcus sp.]MBQ4238653.1 YlxR family protein [Ruminococcus sp.]MBQ6412858.1 YlxR family protein [Ruminococcus sp.]